jgi:hypothetical protein
MSLSLAASLPSDLPPLPPTVVTKDRQIVDTSMEEVEERYQADALIEPGSGLLPPCAFAVTNPEG